MAVASSWPSANAAAAAQKESSELPAAVASAQTDLLAVWLSAADSWAVGAGATVLRCPIADGECVSVAVPRL